MLIVSFKKEENRAINSLELALENTHLLLATVITPLGPPAVLLLEGLATWSSALGALPGSAGPKDSGHALKLPP